jgi:secreted trypsin-like serine protease
MRLLLGPLALFLASSGVLATPHPPLTPTPDGSLLNSRQVVGGDEVESISDYPFMVGIEKSGRGNVCGGSLINSRQVLTAAHCVVNSLPSEVQVRGGTRRRNEGGKVYEVAYIHVNPGYARRTKPYDLAILDLRKKVTASWYASVRLPNSTQALAAGEHVEVVGWGRQHKADPSSRPQILRHRRLTVLPFDVCHRQYASTLSPQNFCTRRSLDEGTGGGDSGGPLLQGNVLRGAVSGSHPEPGTPGYHVNVGAHLDWIRSRWL